MKTCRKCGADLMSHEERYCDSCQEARERRRLTQDPYERTETIRDET